MSVLALFGYAQMALNADATFEFCPHECDKGLLPTILLWPINNYTTLTMTITVTKNILNVLACIRLPSWGNIVIDSAHIYTEARKIPFYLIFS